MFRKIVTELAYSPTLVGDLGYYVKQLRNETSKREIGLIFTLLAVTVQLIAAAFPPESANAHNPEAFIDGEIQSVDDYLEYYDQNTGNVRDLLSSLGITRAEIRSAKPSKLSSGPSASIWLMENSREKENTAHFFRTSQGKPGVAYYQPVNDPQVGSEAYIGSSKTLKGWFAILKTSGNLVTEKPVATACEAWIASPGSPLKISTWSNDAKCRSKVDHSLTARVISANSPEIDQLKALDRVAHTLLIENLSDTPVSLTPSINLEDALEYSRILDYGGGDYDFDTHNLSWKTITLPANKSIKRTFIIQLMPSIPATAGGQYIAASYDCTISLTFGDTLSTPLKCPATKYIERLTNILPSVSGTINIVAAVFLLTVTTFLYLRSRQLLTEIYIIRHNHLGGL